MREVEACNGSISSSKGNLQYSALSCFFVQGTNESQPVYINHTEIQKVVHKRKESWLV